MERQENKYKYSQLETFKEVLELSHLRRKTLIVNILLVVLALLLVYFLFTKYLKFFVSIHYQSYQN